MLVSSALARRESHAMPPRSRGWWCDGFIPQAVHLAGNHPQIVGRAWIMRGQDGEPWDFTLHLRRHFASRDEIEWSSLLPNEGSIGWLSVHWSRKMLEINPSVRQPASD